jgi:hypothetical protein
MFSRDQLRRAASLTEEDISQAMQGIPLSIVQNQKEIAGVTLADDALGLLLRLAPMGATSALLCATLLLARTICL